MTSKHWIISVGLFWGSLGGSFSQDDFSPKPLQIDRYEHIWQQSPFVVETPIAQQSAGLEQQYFLTGIASLNSAPVVFLFDRKSLSRVMVTPDNPAQGIQIVSVDSNPDPQKASVTIKVDQEQAIIHYDASALSPASASTDPKKPPTGTSPTQTPPVAASLPIVVSTTEQSPPQGKAQESTAPTPPPSGTTIRRAGINFSK